MMTFTLPDTHTPATPVIYNILLYEFDFDIKSRIVSLTRDIPVNHLVTVIALLLEKWLYDIDMDTYPLLYYNPICSRDTTIYFGYPIVSGIHPHHLSLDMVARYLDLDSGLYDNFVTMLYNPIEEMVSRWVEQLIVPVKNRYISIDTRGILDGYTYLLVGDDIRTIRFYNAIYYQQMSGDYE